MIRIIGNQNCEYMNYIKDFAYLNNIKYYLNEYHDNSILRSNIVEFWAPVSDIVIPNIIPNRYLVSTFGNTWNTKTNKPFGLSVHRKGYLQYSGFSTIYGNQVTRKLHRVIMMTFCYIDGCENLEVNHIDSNRQNNMLTNLEWTTASENTIHGINNGNKKVFGHDYTVYLDNNDIQYILNLYNSEKYRNKISKNMISGICFKTARLSFFNNQFV